jgi:hypothetical protein
MIRRRGFLGGLLAAPFAASKAATSAPVPTPAPEPWVPSVGVSQWGEAVLNDSLNPAPADNYWSREAERNAWLRKTRPQWLIDQLKNQASRTFQTADARHLPHDIAAHRSWSHAKKIEAARNRWVEEQLERDEQDARMHWSKELWERTLGNILPWERD